VSLIAKPTADALHNKQHTEKAPAYIDCCLCTLLCMPCTLQVELGEQLSQAGSLGSSSSLSAALTSLLGGNAALAAMSSQGSSSSSSSNSAAPLPQPTEAVLLAFIVAVALAELSRAALAPLPDLGAPQQLFVLNVPAYDMVWFSTSYQFFVVYASVLKRMRCACVCIVIVVIIVCAVCADDSE
jgi:hypothetical protein